MAKIAIIGNNEIAKLLSKLKGFSFDLFPLPDIIINCGLYGKDFIMWKKRNWQGIEGIPILNSSKLISKYNMIKIAESIGVSVPDTFMNINIDI